MAHEEFRSLSSDDEGKGFETIAIRDAPSRGYTVIVFLVDKVEGV